MDHDETQVPRVVINPQVTYDVGELLDKLGTRIDAGFAGMKADLASKADKADLAAINARLEEHGKEIGRLKDRQRADETAQAAVSATKKVAADSKQRKWNFTLSFALVLVTASSVLIGVFHF